MLELAMLELAMKCRTLLAFIASLTVLLWATAAAAQGVDPTVADTSLLDLLRPVYEAFSSGRYALTGALIVVVLTALVKRYLGNRISWLHSDAGGSAMALVASAASALAAGLVAPGATITLSLLERALGVGVTAAGGYAILKNLVIDPILRPLAAKAPGWLQPVFQVVLWVFDHPATDPVPVAEAAGKAAVTAKPGTGVEGVVGKPTDIP